MLFSVLQSAPQKTVPWPAVIKLHRTNLKRKRVYARVTCTAWLPQHARPACCKDLVHMKQVREGDCLNVN
jgi:hypothetical protein